MAPTEEEFPHLNKPPDSSNPADTSKEERPSYSAKLMVNVPVNSRLKRNVLEVNLDCEEDANPYKIEDKDVSRLFKALGIDPSVHTEGFQVCPGN